MNNDQDDQVSQTKCSYEQHSKELEEESEEKKEVAPQEGMIESSN